MQNDVSYNKKHKDSLFRFVFKEKEDMLSLYNATNGSDYTDAEKLEIYTMDNYLYMGMKNDLSFLYDMNMNLFEHQSTWNPNMPVRGFIYMGSAFKKYIELNHLDLYSSKKIVLPIPRYFVFYNGTKEVEDEVILRLTDSMQGEDVSSTSCAEFTAHVININAGHSTKYMERCPKLYEYAQFIGKIREYQKQGLELDAAIEAAITYCIAHGILADILRANRAEVTDMIFEEYNAALHIANEKDISFEEGYEKGVISEKENTLKEAKRADEAEQRADEAEQRANEEKQRAYEAEQRERELLKVIEALKSK